MLTVESPSRRRVLVWSTIGLVALAAFAHAWLTDVHLTFVSAVQRTDHPIHTPLERIRPGYTADVDMWIRYALADLEGTEGWRSHHTDVDNAPHGRDVHWNSALTWWIAGLGWTYHELSGTPLPAAVERAAVWANLPLVLAFVLGFGWWAGRRAGALAGVLVALAVFGHRSIYEGFMPAYPDHHGLIAAGILGFMLGVLFMGGGWVRGAATLPGLDLLPVDEAAARSAAAWSGFWGGFGLWISTASLAIPIFMIPLAAGLATLVCCRSLLAAGARFHAGTWRVWGRVGGLTSLGFYLFEYFPHHLSWRLEVNHPLYALAWWAGAELSACALEFIQLPPGERGPAGRALLRCAVWTLPLAAAPAAIILWRGTDVFLVVDPFLVRLHRTIVEFLPFGPRLRMDGVWAHFEYVLLYPVLYLAAITLLFRSSRPARYTLLLLGGPALGLALLAFWQSRWGMLAGGAEVPLLLVTLGAAFARPFWGATSFRRWALGLGAAAFLYLPGTAAVFAVLIQSVQRHAVLTDETLELTYREIAQAIRDSQPTGPVTLFASPNASLGISYYGRFHALGTLYWENRDGLKAAAELNNAPSDEAAAAIIRRLGVTHLAMVTYGNYVIEYAQLVHPNINRAGIENTFGYRLLGKKKIPVWLEPILYRAPRDLRGDLADIEVYLYKVNFHQTRAEALYRLGELLHLQDKDSASLDTFAWAAQMNDKDASPWLRRGEILLRQNKLAAAAENLDEGIKRSPAAARYMLLTQAGIAFDQSNDHALAAGYYSRAVEENMTNGIALNNLAWLLAAGHDDALLDPVRALTLAKKADADEPGDPGNLDTLAAAFAANHRFPEAVTTVERAIAIASAAKKPDQGLIKACQDHLAAYRAQRPWRD